MCIMHNKSRLLNGLKDMKEMINLLLFFVVRFNHLHLPGPCYQPAPPVISSRDACPGTIGDVYAAWFRGEGELIYFSAWK